MFNQTNNAMKTSIGRQLVCLFWDSRDFPDSTVLITTLCLPCGLG